MSSSAPTEGLVPITRAFLARYYDKYPLPPLSSEVLALTCELRRRSDELIASAHLAADDDFLVDEASKEPTHKIDENLWKNREQIEEIIYLLEQSRRSGMWQQKSTSEDMEMEAALDDIGDRFKDLLGKLIQFQQKNAENVFNTVMTYMPQDFRGTLIRQQRERSERNKQAEVEALIISGGSIRERYALLWHQQMERRRQLAQLGSATGVYKALVKYLVGVPQVLLDFVRQINDDNGPMEEQRARYGPSLCTLTKMVITIRVFLHLSLARCDTDRIKDELFVLKRATSVYITEFEAFITFIREVFINSPFFISAADAGAADSRESDLYKEAVIPAGQLHEVIISVDAVNSYIAWDFSLTQGALNKVLDIGFHVEFISPSGQKTLILPYRRYESDQGNFCAVSVGSFKLIWDNTYSAFFKKVLRYKVDVVPPVIEPVEVEPVEGSTNTVTSIEGKSTPPATESHQDMTPGREADESVV